MDKTASSIKISKEKERIKINFYDKNPTKSKFNLISNTNILEADQNIEKRGRKIDLKKKAKFKEIPDRSNLKEG